MSNEEIFAVWMMVNAGIVLVGRTLKAIGFRVKGL